MARSICSISLPEPLKNYVEKRIRHTGYASISEYVRELIRADQRRFGEAVENGSRRLAESPRLASAARSIDFSGYRRG